ncbi:hypothetical protein MPLB_130038 [Mesorhizobium sp. ORS 3324]|nr:hypothetical protein MPLB_130038 [Mesorhizobium sp. ORS 3324]
MLTSELHARCDFDFDVHGENSRLAIPEPAEGPCARLLLQRNISILSIYQDSNYPGGRS